MFFRKLRQLRQVRIRRKSRRKTENVESSWGQTAARASRPSMAWLLVVVAVAMITAGLWMLAAGKRHTATQAPAAVDELQDALENAEAVARMFLAETRPETRLQWARNPDEVKSHWLDYPDEARIAPGRIEKVLGHQDDGDRAVTAFVVALPAGGIRLLEVVRTPCGPKVDWDAYARYGTATWQDLVAGEATRAVVRVFCEPATERPAPFDDPRQWTCFRLSGPDLPQTLLGFAKVGHVREAMMKQVVLGTPNFRQRFVLEVTRHQGADEPLFEITRCLAVGWIVAETHVEQVWQNNP